VGSTFTQFDIGGPVSTSIVGINDNGDIVGTFGSSVQPNQGFLRVGSTVTTFNIAGANGVFGIKINNLDQVVGQYTDASGNIHGYLRKTDGTIKTIDFPGAPISAALGINDAGVIAGTYIVGGVSHGFIDNNGTFVTFDVPGALSTQV